MLQYYVFKKWFTGIDRIAKLPTLVRSDGMLDPRRLGHGGAFPIGRTAGGRGKHNEPRMEHDDHPSRPSPIRFRPKVHKPADAESGTFTARPIVSTTRSVCRPIDRFLSVIVTPLMDKIPFNCNSTGDVLRRLRDFNAWFNGVFSDRPTDRPHRHTTPRIMTADIVALFPSVRWEPALEACSRL